MAVVVIDGLSKQYATGGDFAVRDVSLTVADGEFVVLLGPSGCGKSTVLRMVAGLEPISAGTVSIDGRVMNQIPAKDRDIAMVFQSYALYPHMTVYNNLAFGLRRRGVVRAEIDRRVRRVAGMIGLVPYLDRKPHALSGGQRQRVALGRAIVREPKVFLFDEPLSNLDAALRVSTRNELIKQQHALATTTIYVTHDQVEAMTMGDRICIMNQGEMVQIGAPLEVYRAPADTFVARFLGNPPMNLLRTILTQAAEPALELDGMRLALTGWSAAALAPLIGKPVILGIRPEDLYETPAEVASGPPHLVDVEVEAVELLGAETLLLLALAGARQELIARVGRSTGLKVGARTRIALDSGALHLFDPATNKAIPRTA
jgi:multiple sugar transport system ATP-binding protein